MKLFDMSGLPPTREVQQVNQQKDSIRVAIVKMLTDATKTDFGSHRNHCIGVIRGLLWALLGHDVSIRDIRETKTILDLADIPYTLEDEIVWISDVWLTSHGIIPDEVLDF